MTHEEFDLIMEEYDNYGRRIKCLYSDGWGFEREFDNAWSVFVPARVIETIHGKIVFERYYNEIITGS